MSGQVAASIARERSRILRELAAQKKREFQQSFVGREMEAITLNVYDGECTEALTDNYLKLRLAGQHAANRWVSSHISGLEDDALWGSVSG